MSAVEYKSGSITVNSKQLDKLSDEFGGFPSELSKSVISALDRTKSSAMTQLGRVIPKHFTITRRQILEASKTKTIVRAMNRSGELSISITGRTLTLARFQHAPVIPQSGKKYQVKARVKKSSPFTAINAIEGDDGVSRLPFIRSTGARSSDKIQYNIFIQTGKRKKKRMQIRPLYSISVPQMALSAEAGTEIVNAISETFDKRLQHEIERRLDIVKQEVQKA